MKKTTLLLAVCVALCSAGTAHAQAVARGNRTVIEVAGSLANGQYVWAPELSTDGPALMVVNLATQRAILFRNGVPIAATTVSTGKEGNETPTGVFTILQKRAEHYSSTYNNAPMPNMQRLTWGGIALHAGNLPGYPASHGCIRLPMAFSKLLFGATDLGMTVIITSIPDLPHDFAEPDIAATAAAAGQHSLETAPFEWHPQSAPLGIVSVIVSVADQRAIVLREGVEIGSAPVRVDGPVGGGLAYVYRAWDGTGRQWLKLNFSGAAQGMQVPASEGQRFDAPLQFRTQVSDVLQPGSVVIVTPESLGAGSTGSEQTVIENDDS